MISALAWVPKGAARAEPKVTEPTAEELEAMKQEALAGGSDDEDNDVDSGSGNASMSEDEDEETAGPSGKGGEGQADSDEEAEDPSTAAAHARAAAAALVAAGSGKKAKRGGADTGSGHTDGIEAALRELDMEHYDSDDDNGTGTGRAGADILSRALNGRLDIHRGEDEYMIRNKKSKKQQLNGGDSDVTDSDSEAEDLRILPTDLVILAARSEDELHNLEVWVYEEAPEVGGEANVYVHHELVLPNFPLCIEWMDCDPRSAQDRGNLVAVGTLDPGIEIWDLDTLDAVEPVTTLGGYDKQTPLAPVAEDGEGEVKLNKNQKKKLKAKAKKRGPSYLPGSHTGGVLGLSWNKTYRNVLASAGEDCTVKIWDIVKGAPEHTLTHHKDKVQAVTWNTAEPSVLLTGSFDRTAALVDVRAASSSAAVAVWQLSADCEAVCWCPQLPTTFLVSSEDGMTVCYDARKGAGSSPLWQLKAHDKPTCALSWCPGTGGSGLLATGSTDRVVKLWDVRDNKPSLVASQDLQVGAVFTLGFSADSPYLLAVGGADGSVSVWDVRAVEGVRNRFPGLLPNNAQAAEQ